MLSRIKRLCQQRGISIAKLERDLNFANGSIAKSDEKIQANRLYAIAEYFQISMEYLLHGKQAYPDLTPVIEIIANMGYELCDIEDPTIYYEAGSHNGDLTPRKGDGRTYEIGVRTSDLNYPKRIAYWESEQFFDLLKKIQKTISNEIYGIQEPDIDTSFKSELYEAYINSSYKDIIDQLLTREQSIRREQKL